MYTKKFFGSALFITSASFYLASLTSSMFLVYYLHQKYVNKIQGTAINNWLTLTGVGAALSFTLAIALMVGVNAIIQEEKKQIINTGEQSHRPRSVAEDCFSNLLFWWCCCGPDINICSNNNRSTGNDKSDGFCVIILATLAVCGCMVGYLVYAFKIASRLCEMKSRETRTSPSNSHYPTTQGDNNCGQPPSSYGVASGQSQVAAGSQHLFDMPIPTDFRATQLHLQPSAPQPPSYAEATSKAAYGAADQYSPQTTVNYATGQQQANVAGFSTGRVTK